MSVNASRLGQGQATLLCLDTLNVADAPAGDPTPPPWARNAARILTYARAHGWLVAHVLRRRPTGADRWCDAFGLSPRLDERVFHREEASAFSSAEFRGVAPVNAVLVILGRSIDGALLRTAREALAMGFAIAVASDSVAAPASERADLARLASAVDDGQAGQLVLDAGLPDPRPLLTVIQGGRAGPVTVAAGLHGGAHDL